MGGVDVSDLKPEYSGAGRSSKKIVDIYIAFRPKCVSCELFHLIWPDKSSPSIAHGNRQLTFRRNLVRQRIRTSMSRKRTGRKRNLPIGTAFLFHTLQKMSGRAKVCALSIDKKKKAPSGRGKQTKYKCKQCDLPLCRVRCFLEYHEQRNMEVQN